MEFFSAFLLHMNYKCANYVLWASDGVQSALRVAAKEYIIKEIISLVIHSSLSGA